jgi:hypothetical protein
MSTSQYYVVGNNDVWMIQFKDTENGQYKSSNEAISFANRANAPVSQQDRRWLMSTVPLDLQRRFEQRWAALGKSRQRDHRYDDRYPQSEPRRFGQIGSRRTRLA